LRQDNRPVVSDRIISPAPAGSDFFGDYSPAVTCASAVILVLAISVIDKLTGYDLQIAILHLIPIVMVTWAAGMKWGIGIALGALALWVSIFRGEHHYSSNLYFYWDALELLITFLTVTVLVARLREALRAHEFSLAILEKLDVPAYVVDLQRDVVLTGNRRFRETYEGRSAEELARKPAHEARFALQDGRPVLLRILAG
jgi:hypothetical protein